MKKNIFSCNKSQSPGHILGIQLKRWRQKGHFKLISNEMTRDGVQRLLLNFCNEKNNIRQIGGCGILKGEEAFVECFNADKSLNYREMHV